MASSPPFLLEDQTDEDFFDKLVDDDFNVASSSSASVVPNLLGDVDFNDSDEAKAFANLSIDDSEVVEGDARNASVVDEEEKKEEKKGSSLVLASSVGYDNGVVRPPALSGNKTCLSSDNLGELSSNGAIGEGAVEDLAVSNGSESGGLGVKEVKWSAFNSDSLHNGDGFGSYSDIFGEFGYDGESAMNNLTGESGVVSGVVEHKSAGLDNANNYSQYGAESNQSADVQDLDNSQDWENMYPGWKYDHNSGQWYQVDGYDVAATNVQGQGVFDSTVNTEKSDVSYLQQSSQSSVGTMPQSGTTESVTNWNQDSHMANASESGSNWNQVGQATESTEDASSWNQVSQGNEYPSHMIFDPQYPGWYYDSIAQEWHSLETYVPSVQSNVQTEKHLSQNGFGSAGMFHGNDQTPQGAHGQVNEYGFGQNYDSAASYSYYSQQSSNMWQSNSVGTSVATSDFSGNQQLENQFEQKSTVNNSISQQNSYNYENAVSYNNNSTQGLKDFSPISGHQSFVPTRGLSQQFNQPQIESTQHLHVSNDYYGNQNAVSYSQQPYHTGQQFSYTPAAGRSSAGRPPHALVVFGFGGKLITMIDSTSVANSSYGSQGQLGGSISVLSLMEVANGRTDSLSPGVCDYFNALCRQSFPGPLAGGNVGAKELNKWTDERLAHCESPDMDHRKGEVLRLLISLFKIGLQHYGKLRSPFGTETMLKENDAPESAVARLFASAKRHGSRNGDYSSFTHLLQKLPSEGRMRATAAEVQTLLVSGRKKEALQCAQEGQLWGPALVLAAQFGDQFYADTVKQMALRQLVAGSPLRTLCLLIAGQPADVFSAGAADDGVSSSTTMPQPPVQLGANGMLDDWEENLAVITANRTNDDELVLIHLGDCLWKERSEIIAAHICYLVAEANFEPYSDIARLCLVGADHLKFPRTYASPEAIQRTEIYEYSKLLGNSQFTLLPFQPYKLVYAHMLAEVGRVSDSLKYCQAISKSLKTGRAPEVETWKQLTSSLEERIKSHQQGGFSTNLAPAKLVGKLLNLFDSTAHRVVGGLPPPAPSATAGNMQGSELHNQSSVPRVSISQSTMSMSSLIPSPSMEPISEWTADSIRRPMHSRSVSEPDFGKTPRQDHIDSSKEETSAGVQGKTSVSGVASRFGRFGFGSQILQKILNPRQDKQAKLGETNKFYYDEKLKRWVEEGVEPPAEEAALPPPPTNATFQNGMPDYNLNSAVKSENLQNNGSPDFRSPASFAHSSGIPPIPPTSNLFSARGRTGVRSRYVDTFNKVGENPTNLFQSTFIPTIKQNSNANPKFFVPALVSSVEQVMNTSSTDDMHQTTSGNENSHDSSVNNSFQSFGPPSSPNMQRFASMGNISNKGAAFSGSGSGSLSSHSRRTASWSGSFEVFQSE